MLRSCVQWNFVNSVKQFQRSQKCLGQSEAGLSWFSHRTEKHKFGRGRRDLDSCQVGRKKKTSDSVLWQRPYTNRIVKRVKWRNKQRHQKVRLGYCFTPYQRLRLYNGAPFSRLLRSRWGYGGHILDLTPRPSWGELNRKQDLKVLYQVSVFWTDLKNKMAALASDWLRLFSTSPLKPLNGIQRNFIGSKTSISLTHLCFSGRSEKQDGRRGLWFAETFSTSLKPLNRMKWHLTGSKISTSSTKFVFFGPIGKTRWPPRPLIGRDIFVFSSETTERNSMKLDRKQDLNFLYQGCVFGPIVKTRWPPWPLIGWDIFDFSVNAERNSTKLDR